MKKELIIDLANSLLESLGENNPSLSPFYKWLSSNLIFQSEVAKMSESSLSKLKGMKPNQCFSNALYCCTHDDICFNQGFTISFAKIDGELHIAKLIHAWVDSKGIVLDPTLQLFSNLDIQKLFYVSFFRQSMSPDYFESLKGTLRTVSQLPYRHFPEYDKDNFQLDQDDFYGSAYEIIKAS